MLKRRDAFLKRAGSEYGPAALSSGSGSGYFNRTDSPGDHSSFLFGNSVAGRSSGDIRNVWLIGDDSFY
ncbi:hypothetical protein ECZU29_12060 [Escherichia coli]|nr:hypothetical protein ECZU29_12060 [Escherichia coli]